MFSQKSITKIPTPTFAKSTEKVGVAISVIDFCENIFMSSDKSQNLQNKFLFNLRRRSTLYDFPFQSYDQNKMSKNVTLLHSAASVTWTSRITPSSQSLPSSLTNFFLFQINLSTFISSNEKLFNSTRAIRGHIDVVHPISSSDRTIDLQSILCFT